MDGPSGSRETSHLDTSHTLRMHRVGFCDKGHVTINILPDDVLLLIFQSDGQEDSPRHLSWHRLTHVCRRWRSVVFGSPRFLGLKLVCDASITRVENIGIWPPLPIVMKSASIHSPTPKDYDFDAFLYVAFEHRSRVCEIDHFDLTNLEYERLSSMMQEKFPALTHLLLGRDSDDRDDQPVPVLPNGFLGGAPHLKSLTLNYILFPALPNLLLSATDLVDLELQNIHHSEFTSPERIVTNLAVSANLESFTIGFEFPLSHRDTEIRRRPPLTRSILPALGHLKFKGSSEYLEDLLSRIDAPLLYTIYIRFPDQRTFDTQQLAQFIGRTPKFKTFEEAHVSCCYGRVFVRLYFPLSKFIKLEVTCRGSSYLEPSFLMSTLPPLPTVERLYLCPVGISSTFKDDWCITNTQLLEHSCLFTALKELHLESKKFGPVIMPMLQALGERVTDVLPTLQDIFLPELELSGPIQEAIQQFATARRLSGHPLTVHIGDKSDNTG